MKGGGARGGGTQLADTAAELQALRRAGREPRGPRRGRRAPGRRRPSRSCARVAGRRAAPARSAQHRRRAARTSSREAPRRSRPTATRAPRGAAATSRPALTASGVSSKLTRLRITPTTPPTGWRTATIEKGDYKAAVLRFADVVQRYPTGDKAPDALYRQGEALLRLGPEVRQRRRDGLRAADQRVSGFPARRRGEAPARAARAGPGRGQRERGLNVRKRDQQRFKKILTDMRDQLAQQRRARAGGRRASRPRRLPRRARHRLLRGEPRLHRPAARARARPAREDRRGAPRRSRTASTASARRARRRSTSSASRRARWRSSASTARRSRRSSNAAWADDAPRARARHRDLLRRDRGRRRRGRHARALERGARRRRRCTRPTAASCPSSPRATTCGALDADGRGGARARRASRSRELAGSRRHGGPRPARLAARRPLLRQGAGVPRGPAVRRRPSSRRPPRRGRARGRVAASRPTSGSSSPAATPRSTASRRDAPPGAARRDPRRRRRRGLRQGRQAARPPVPGRARRSRVSPSRATRARSRSRAPLADAPGFDFSYSGLKTAVALEIERRRAAGGARRSASRRPRGVVPGGGDGSARGSARGARCARRGCGRVAVVGGVAANLRLRREMERAGREDGFSVALPAGRALHRQRGDGRCRRRAHAGARRAPRPRAFGVLPRPARRAALGAGPRGVSPAEIRALLERHGLRARRDLGQNFLADARLAAKLAAEAHVAAGDACSRSAAASGC